MAVEAITGDFHALQVVIERLSEVTKQGFRRDLLQRLGAASIARIGLEFETGTDPYGRAWAPTTSRDGQTLRDTGRLLNSFTPKIAGDSFRLGTAVIYAGVHQYGATIKPTRGKYLRFKIRTQWVQVQQVVIPARQMLPEGDLGPIWSADFTNEAAEFVAEHLAA